MAYLQLQSGRKLYYEDEGAGKPVVFIHGWKASADVYAEPSKILTAAGSYRCIRYDHCGHKRSEIPAEGPSLQTLAEDLRELITALHLEKPILVGWSMGGMTVLEYIRLYGSEGLDRVAIVDISPRSLNDETVVLLSREKADDHIRFSINTEDLQKNVGGYATYGDIKAYVLEKFGLKVSSLNIGQTKDKCGIKERENYNKGKDGHRVPNCTPEKEQAIMDAFRHFGMLRD